MADSPKWNVTKYISDYAASRPNHKWLYPIVFEKSFLNTIIKIKTARVVIISKLNNFDRTVTTNSVFFKLLCLTFLNTIDHERNNSDIAELSEKSLLRLRGIYRLSKTILFDEIQNKISLQSIHSYHKLLDMLENEVIFLCWHFYALAREEKIVFDLIDEHHLMKEIEKFK